MRQMKNTEKKQMYEYRGLRKGRLIKRLSGILAVLTAVTMLISGQMISFYGYEPGSANALAGERSGEDIIIHFGEGEDKEIHVIPTSTIPQGITAVINFNPECGGDENRRDDEHGRILPFLQGACRRAFAMGDQTARGRYARIHLHARR